MRASAWVLGRIRRAPHFTVVTVAPTLDWLRERSAESLVTLLRARPDLTLPAPSDLAVLARRLDTPPSVQRAVEQLDRFHLQILQATALLAAPARTTDRRAIAELLGPEVDNDAIDRGAGELEAVGLLRGGDPVGVAPGVHAILGEFPGGLGPRGRLSGRPLEEALAGAAPAAQALLRRLDAGQPRGSVPPSGSTRELVGDLVRSGLLLEVDEHTVLLPREVSERLRAGRPLGPVSAQPPPIRTTDPGRGRIDATAGGQALAAVALTQRLLAALGRQPAPALKAGGLGVRETRRLAKELAVAESLVVLHLEVAAEANLLAVSDFRAAAAPAWTPTQFADEFEDLAPEQAWVLLASTWLTLRRDPARVGSRDESAHKVVNALSFDAVWTRGPAERRLVLGALGSVPAGLAPARDDVRERLAWSSPLRDADRLGLLVASILEQATTLGLVAFDGTSVATRDLLADRPDEAARALSAALPDPVDQILVQADLTAIAPGRLDPDLAARLAQVAEVESAGSATVYRITQDSLRRALDAGLSASDLHQLFDRHSATAVPQALDYLIDDLARRHGVLRLGAAAGYLRSDDPALVESAVGLAQAAGLPVRRLAPTVAVTSGPLEDLLDVLRQGGLVPAAEDEAGTVVSLTPRPHRTRAGASPGPARREAAGPSDEQLAALVNRLQAGSVAQDQTPSETLSVLRHAVDFRTPVWINYLDAEGSPVRRLIDPVAVSGGTVAAFDHLRQAMRTFALHRISGVTEG